LSGLNLATADPAMCGCRSNPFPCRAYSPMVSEMAEKFESEDLDVNVYGVAVRERDPQKAFEYVKSNGYKHTVLVSAEDGRDTALRAASGFKVRLYPSIAVVDREGNVVHFAAGAGQAEARSIMDKVEEAVREALGEDA